MCLRIQHAENCTAVVAEEHTSVFGRPDPAYMDAIASLIEEALVVRRDCLVLAEPMQRVVEVEVEVVVVVVLASPLRIQQHRPTYQVQEPGLVEEVEADIELVANMAFDMCLELGRIHVIVGE
jgi:hypothetical protein